MIRRRRPRGGFVLIEASIVYVILALALVSLLPLFILCFRSSKKTKDIVVATQLCSEMLEEIRVRRWDNLTPASLAAVESGSRVLGAEGEDNGADKTTFNDVDDFKDWAEVVPLDPGMQPIAGLKEFGREVSVDYVSAADPNVISPVPTDFKRVTVCARSRQTSRICLQTLLANR